MAGLYDLLDQVCAERLGVPVEDYVNFVENCLSESRAESVVMCLLDEDSTDEQIETCKRIYDITQR